MPCISRLVTACSVLIFLLAACGQPERSAPNEAERIVLANRGDSLAYAVYRYHGGPEGWERARHVRYMVSLRLSGDFETRVHHAWDRASGAYRVEWWQEEDSLIAALFNVVDRENAQIFVNGEPVSGADHETLRRRAQTFYLHDSYWILSVPRLFEPGVSRHHEPDSGDGTLEVVRVAFLEGVLADENRFWFHLDPESGRVERWSFTIHGETVSYDWMEYVEHRIGGASLRIATRFPQRAGAREIRTGEFRASTEVEEEMYFDPKPRLLKSPP